MLHSLIIISLIHFGSCQFGCGYTGFPIIIIQQAAAGGRTLATSSIAFNPYYNSYNYYNPYRYGYYPFQTVARRPPANVETSNADSGNAKSVAAATTTVKSTTTGPTAQKAATLSYLEMMQNFLRGR